MALPTPNDPPPPDNPASGHPVNPHHNPYLNPHPSPYTPFPYHPHQQYNPVGTLSSAVFGHITGRSLYPAATKPPKHEGIVLGEIIAWRAWRVRNNALVSMMVDHPWQPGEVVSGRVDGGSIDGNLGVHAWKHRLKAEQYSHEVDNASAVGTVALWGEIVEHEDGYRAEHARVASIDMVRGSWVMPLTLRSLQKTYGVGFAPEPEPPAPKPSKWSKWSL